jgi:phenylalanyl-tRNA synthetase beta chain
VRVRRGTEVLSERLLHLGGVVSHSRADFTEAKSCVEALFTSLGVPSWRVKDAKHPSFIPGRTAAVYIGRSKVGILGEVHPEVLNNFDLENPVSAFEINIKQLAERGITTR